MTENHLKRINITAILKIPSCKRMAQKMRVQPFNTGCRLQISKKHLNARLLKRRNTATGKLLKKEKRRSARKRNQIGIKLQRIPSLISKRYGSLFVAFAINDHVTLANVQTIDSDRDELVKAKAAIEIKRKDRSVTPIEKSVARENVKELTDLFIRKRINHVAPSLGKLKARTNINLNINVVV